MIFILHFVSMGYHVAWLADIKLWIKESKIGKEEVNFSLFLDDILYIYIENPKDFSKKWIKLVNSVKMEDTKFL